MKVAIHHQGKEGFIKYNKGNHEIMVTHPDEIVRRGVRKYLNTKREFVVPGSKHVGDRKVIEGVPNESVDNMLMALTEMHHITGVHVNWGHKDTYIEGVTPDPNAKADKPILKSIDGGTFEIIN